MVSNALNEQQIEILKLFSRKLDNEDLMAIKDLIVKYLAEKATRMADQIWDEKGWDDGKVDEILETNLRTAYKTK